MSGALKSGALSLGRIIWCLLSQRPMMREGRKPPDTSTHALHLRIIDDTSQCGLSLHVVLKPADVIIETS